MAVNIFKKKAKFLMLNLDNQHWLESVGIQQQHLSAGAEGLTSAEANVRIAKYGKNITSVIKKSSLVLQFLSRFRNPLVILLLVASAVSAFTADLVSFVIIVCMVVLSVTLDFIQEHRAENAAQALRRSVAIKATEYLKKPRQWDMKFIRNFMLLVGPVSSIFDFLTFYVMLNVFNAKEELFRTGWFVESIVTQVLVIFIIRTRRNIFKSKPNSWLVYTSLFIVGVAITLPFTSIGAYFGFSPLPIKFFTILLTMGIGYLVMVEFVKRWFYRVYYKTKF